MGPENNNVITKQAVKSDAAWYFRDNKEEKRFYDIFFQYCHKYNISWPSASDKEKAFIEEITRVTYERERAIQLGTPLSETKPTFVSLG